MRTLKYAANRGTPDRKDKQILGTIRVAPRPFSNNVAKFQADNARRLI